jgi:hypothetical protein
MPVAWAKVLAVEMDRAISISALRNLGEQNQQNWVVGWIWGKGKQMGQRGLCISELGSGKIAMPTTETENIGGRAYWEEDIWCFNYGHAELEWH